MQSFTERIERERAALAAAGDTAALTFTGADVTTLPAIRLYPTAPALGSVAAAAEAVWNTVVPGADAVRASLSSAARRMLPAGSPTSTSGSAAPPPVLHRLVYPQADPSAVILAPSTAAAVGVFLKHAGLHARSTVLVPGLLLSPHHSLIDVVRRDTGARVVAFDFCPTTMEADMAGLRAALTRPAGEGPAPAGAVLLVGLRGRRFRNEAEVCAVARDGGFAVVVIQTPIAGGGNPRLVATAGSTPPGTPPVLHLTACDGPGSLGGAVGCCADPALAAALQRRLDAVPVAGPLTTWLRLARHVASVLLSERFDYGTVVWMLALLSRAARALVDQLPPRQGRPSRGARDANTAVAAAHVSGDRTAPTAMEGARQDAMDWLYELLASDTSGDGGTVPGLSAGSWAGLRAVARAATATLPRPPAWSSLEKARARLTPPASPSPARTPTLRWLRRVLAEQQAQRDADVLCLWSALYHLPSYVRVVSADTGSPSPSAGPEACVEAGMTSIVLRARCPALVARRLQEQGFAAQPVRAVAVSADGRPPGSVPPVAGGVYFAACAQCAAAAGELCVVPLCARMSPADRERLVDIVSEMPRLWHTNIAQPVARVTTGDYQRTDGTNISEADRPYNTPAVRALLHAICARQVGGPAGAKQGESGGPGLEEKLKLASSKLYSRRHPLLTYLIYGSQGLYMLVPKL